MPSRLYLDTARLGLTSTSAQQALEDFVRLTAEEGCSLYFEKFLHEGHAAWPTRLRIFYSRLRHWQGIATLKVSLRTLAETLAGSGPLLANRSAQLMRLAAKLLVKRCRRILLTDLSWPGYAAILEQQAQQERNVELVRVCLRSAILDDQISEYEVLARLASASRRENCDGLFLPAVSNDGIRLPLKRICQTLGHPRRPRFVVIDGAQALCHTGCRPGIRFADLYLAGCHKWLHAGSVPLGMAFSPRRRSRNLVHATAEQMLKTTELDDPLLRFIHEIESGRVSRFSETVSLASLFACQAAALQRRREQKSLPAFFACQCKNADAIGEAATAHGWQPLRPAESLRSGILLLRAKAPAIRTLPPDSVRNRFQQQGVALTAYDGGVVRLSMPQVPLQYFEMDDLLSALRHCADPRTADESQCAGHVQQWAG